MIQEVAHTPTECEHLVGAGTCTTLPDIIKFEMEQIELYRFQGVNNKVGNVVSTTADGVFRLTFANSSPKRSACIGSQIRPTDRANKPDRGSGSHDY